MFQPATAGADAIIAKLEDGLENLKALCQKFTKNDLETVIVKRNSQSRKREGLEVGEPVIYSLDPAADNVRESLSRFPIQLQTNRSENFSLEADLIGGQKTGFFLDQRENIDIVCRSLENFVKNRTPGEPIRILDLCSYVGHWSARVALELKNLGAQAEVHLFDASESALEIGQKNLSNLGFEVSVHRGDVMEDLRAMNLNGRFDIVIADPPALIKSRTGLEAGKRAYTKLNAEALKLVKDGGLLVTCSCSGLLTEADFVESLDVSAAKAHRDLAWIRRGFQSADHPVDAHFPEGQYLKCLVGLVDA